MARWGRVGWPPGGGIYHIDWLVGSSLNDSGINFALEMDETTETGATADIFVESVAQPYNVLIAAGVVVTGFHVEASWSPSFTGDVYFQLTIEDPTDFSDVLSAFDTDTGTVSSVLMDETTASFSLGSVPFTVPVDARMNFLIVTDPEEAGHTITSGFLEFTYE